MSFILQVGLRIAANGRALGIGLRFVGLQGVALAGWAESVMDALYLALVGARHLGRLFGAGAAFMNNLEGVEGRAREQVRNLEGVARRLIGMGTAIERLFL